MKRSLTRWLFDTGVQINVLPLGPLRSPKPTGQWAVPEYPHCDARELHAPGKCLYCEHYPDWQQLRKAWGIAFTGETPEPGQVPCPSDWDRYVETIEAWPGHWAQDPISTDEAVEGLMMIKEETA